MSVGRRYRVVVRISKGIPAGEGSFSETSHQQENRPLTFMGATLSGESFDIKPLTYEEQPVPDWGYTEWSWEVVPLDGGLVSLFLTVVARTQMPGEGQVVKQYPPVQRIVAVAVDRLQFMAEFIGGYWKWLLGLLIPLGLAGWLLARRLKASGGAPAGRAKD